MEQTHVIPEQRTNQEAIEYLSPIADRHEEFPEETALRSLSTEQLEELRTQLRSAAERPEATLNYLAGLSESIQEALGASNGVLHRDDIQETLFNPFVDHLLDQVQHASDGRHRNNRVAVARAATNVVYAELLQGTHDPRSEYWQTV